MERGRVVWDAVLNLTVKNGSEKIVQDRLKKLAYHKFGWKSYLKKLSFKELRELKFRCELIGNKREKDRAVYRIDSYLVKKFCSVGRKPVLRITHSDCINYHTLYEVVRRIIRCSDMGAVAKFVIKSSCKAVLRRDRTVGEVLINNSKMSEDFCWHKAPQCDCKNGHILVRMEDFNDEIVRRVAAVNAKFVPATKFSEFRFLNEVCDYLESVGPFPKAQDYVNMTHVQDVGGRLLFLFKLLGVKSKYHQRILAALRSCAFDNGVGHGNDLTMRDVRKVRERLRGLVITPIDKNAGKLLVECRLVHWQRMKANLYDHPNFTLWGRSSRVILGAMKCVFQNMKLDRIVNWRASKASIPSAKVHSKDKDVVNKSRLIASYFNHPLKRLFKLVSKVLTWLLRGLPKVVKHFTLQKLDDITRKVEGLSKKFEKLGFKDCGILPFQTDVTCMFTNLDQGQIRQSVRWLLDLSSRFCPKRTGKNVVHISKLAPYEVAWGRGYEEENHVTISFEDIINTVELDLGFAFTAVGMDIFRQKQGCPIGGCLSSNYANIKCAFDESDFLRRNHNFAARVFAIRQMDDMAGWIAYDKSDEGSYSLAEFLKRMVLKSGCIYKGGLILEEQEVKEEQGRFTHKFAGVSLVGDRNVAAVTAISRNKNWELLKSEGRQKVLTFPHVLSRVSDRVKVGVQIGTLTRIHTQCSRPGLVVPCFLQNCVEMESLGYDRDFLFRCLNRVRKKSVAMEWIVKNVKTLLIQLCGDGPARSGDLVDFVECCFAQEFKRLLISKSL